MTKQSFWVSMLVVVFLCQGLPAAAPTNADLRAKELGLQVIDWPAVRTSSERGVLGDVDSHLWPDHPYRDSSAGTWAHEGTHGVNSLIRGKYGGDTVCNGFYILGNYAVVIKEPGVRLSVVVRHIPPSLEGLAYDGFRNERRYWENQTLFLFDDWAAYVNGTWVVIERKEEEHSSSTLQMASFTVYCLAAMQAVANHQPDYDLTQLRAFTAWMIEKRVLPLLKRARDTNSPAYAVGADQCLQRLRTSSDAESLRQFVRGHFGREWTKMFLGF